jgi:hypothetical protein
VFAVVSCAPVVGDESCDTDVVSVSATSSAHAMCGNATAWPTPNATANAPTRPSCLAYPIANPSVRGARSLLAATS